ncbi:MAG: 3-oxoacyl-ACP reductase family protein [Rhodospirillales bacterium]|jgi:3-oxoacyl-[acyl-carrier protein] reductase|nr:3-oxoacyl-ACP reductase family protein [Rhodospirillales bacterium]
MDGRVCIVTGGGQGLGRAFAKHFAANGAITVIAELIADNGQAVAAEITDANGKALAVATDVGDSASVRAMVEKVMGEFGRVDILINNAALLSSLRRSPLEGISDEEWDQVMRVNITGAFYCARAVAPIMRQAGWGRIINLSSDTALNPPPLTFAHYVTSKAALVGFTRTLARELGPDGITVNAIMPGSTETEIDRGEAMRENRAINVLPRQAIPRQEVPEDLVGAALFLASEGAGFITGQTLPVNGGLAFV